MGADDAPDDSIAASVTPGFGPPPTRMSQIAVGTRQRAQGGKQRQLLLFGRV